MVNLSFVNCVASKVAFILRQSHSNHEARQSLVISVDVGVEMGHTLSIKPLATHLWLKRMIIWLFYLAMFPLHVASLTLTQKPVIPLSLHYT